MADILTGETQTLLLRLIYAVSCVVSFWRRNQASKPWILSAIWIRLRAMATYCERLKRARRPTMELISHNIYKGDSELAIGIYTDAGGHPRVRHLQWG
jgi:hypothetical protein